MGIAILVALDAVQVFSYKGVIAQYLCEQELVSGVTCCVKYGDEMLRIFPTQAQAAVLGIAIGCLAAAQLLLAWLLIKPLIFEECSAQD